MTFLRGAGAVAAASDERAIDWDAVISAATAGTDAGAVSLSAAERAELADDVRTAAERIRDVSGLDVEDPDAIYAQNRHHWIEANVETFRPALAPLAERPRHLPALAARVNTAAMAGSLAVLSRFVLGQYDPPLFRQGDPRLSVVVPNVERAAGQLDVDPAAFRRWIVLHEVAHAAEFQAAPWLRGHLEERIEAAVEGLAEGGLDSTAFRQLDLAMSVVEGYAECVMDRAFDGPVEEFREKLDARRRGGGPLARLLRRLLGLGIKRRQYEVGGEFFEAVARERGLEGAGVVWRDPETLPTRDELEAPATWLARGAPRGGTWGAGAARRSPEAAVDAVVLHDVLELGL